MIIFGANASNIGNFKVDNSKCGYCGQESSQRISVFGKYAHIFWIPFFPMGTKAVAECVHCKRTIEQIEFSPELDQLYLANKSKAKRPIWHWLGVGLIGFLIALIMIIGITAEEDLRSDLLQSDIENMTSIPTMESDSIAYKIKEVFDNFVNEEIKPSEFEYFTKIEGDKALILIKIPKLRKIEKSERSNVIEMIEMITDNQKDLMDKKKYIGVQGLVSMMLIKTPTYEKNSRLALSSELHEFYGPKSKNEE